MPKQAVYLQSDRGKSCICKESKQGASKIWISQQATGSLWNPTAELVTLFWEWPSKHSELWEAESSTAHMAQIAEKKRCLGRLWGGSC